MACTYNYNGTWYTEDELREVFNGLQSAPVMFQAEQAESVDLGPVKERIKGFLSQLNVNVQTVEDVKALTGYDAASVTDLLYKTILVKDDEAQTENLLKETAYVAYSFLGKKNKIRTDLMQGVEQLDNYDAIFAQYKSRSPKLSDYKIKELIVVDYLADAIKDNYNHPRESYTNREADYWRITGKTGLERKLKYLLSQIRRFIEKLLNTRKLTKEETSALLDDLANDVLTNNFQKFGTTLSESQQLTNYNNTVQRDEKAKDIIEAFQGFGLLLTGSLSLRRQGTVYREASEDLHDLDFSVPKTLWGAYHDELVSEMENSPLFQTETGRQYLADQFTKKLKDNYRSHPIINKIKEKFPSFKITASFAKDGTVTIAGDIDGYSIDLFFHINPTDNNEKTFQDWQPIFQAKLKMGRAKDLRDFANYVPFNDNVQKIAQTPGFRHFNFEPIRKSIQKAGPVAATPTQIQQLKDWLNRIGVEIRGLAAEYQGLNGVANLAEKWIGLAEGKEDVALPEEAFHFATEIIKQTNPKLYREMFNAIGSYQLYQDTFTSYKGLKEYQINGKPDIPKIKDEAIGKMLAAVYATKDSTQEEEFKDLQKAQSWLSRIIDWFKQLLGIAGYNPFEVAVEEALSVSPEVAQGALENSDTGAFFQTNPGESEQDRLFNAVKTNKGVPIAKVDANPVTNEKRHYLINGVMKIFKTVTDRTSRYYERVRGEFSTKSEYQKAVDDLKAEEGTKGHADMEQIVNSLIDENGLLKPNPEKDPNYVPQTNQEIYGQLYNYALARMNQFPAGTKFATEVMIYHDVEKEAGTIDFLAIDPTGQATILDWKFQDLGGKKDVPWYKKEANNIQIGRYKQILQDMYGITKFGRETAAIPIHTITRSTQLFKDKGDVNYYPVLVDIVIGDPNVENETRTELLPVMLKDASSGDPILDSILQKLRAAEEALLEQRKASRDDKKRHALLSQIELLTQAIRHLQVSRSLGPFLDQAEEFIARTSTIVDEFKNTINPLDFEGNKAVFNEFAIRIQRAFTELNIYKDLDTETDHLFDDPSSPMAEKAALIAHKARSLHKKMVVMNDEFTVKVGEAKNIRELLKPEVMVKAIARLFTETSKLPTKALNLFSKLRTEAKHKADFQTDRENAELVDIEKEYMEWAKNKGLSKGHLFDLFTKKAKRWVNGQEIWVDELLDQYKAEFYQEGKVAAKKRDTAWIKDNVDMTAFKEELAKQKQLELEVIHSRGLTDEKLADEEARLDAKYSLKEDPTTGAVGNGWTMYFSFRKFPLKKHETAQWITLHDDANIPARKFYEWIIKMNEKAYQSGYLPQGQAARTFLPFVPKSLVEKLVEAPAKGFHSLVDAFWQSVTIDENSVGYGEVDEATGRLKDKIPTYLTRPSVEGHSDQLFRNMALFNQFVNEHEALSEIEGLALAIGRTEANKASINTSTLGASLRKKGELDINYAEGANRSNADLYEAQMKALIYGQKYVQSERFDVLMGQVNPLFMKINKTIGFKLFPENLEGRQISLNKTIDGINNWFQIKALGVNPVTALSNRLGGFFQSVINAGTWFNKMDVMKAEAQLLTTHLNGESGKKFIAALRYFMPFTENANRETMKKLAGTWLDASTIQDWLMVMMRSGDRGVQAQVFHTLYSNMIVVDGQIHNAREYYRNSQEYKERYKKSEGDRKTIEQGFDKAVADLKEKYGLEKLASIDKNGMLVIPGVERESSTVFKARNLSHELSKKTTGQMTDDEIRGYQQNIWTKSMMIFKNWIPSLADTRFGKLKFNDKTQAYEWGRARTFVRYLLTDTWGALTNFIGVVKATDKGMKSLDKMYNEKKARYERETGKTFEITREEFYDMTRQNLRQVIKDAILTLSLLSLYLLAKASVPDEDEDPMVKNWYKFMVKVVDKIKDELSFFYNPFSANAILNGSIFPSLSIITDGLSVLTHFAKEVWGISLGDEKMVKENYTIKYLLKSFPVTSQISSWLPLMAPDAAKEYGIRMSSESRAGR